GDLPIVAVLVHLTKAQVEVEQLFDVAQPLADVGEVGRDTGHLLEKPVGKDVAIDVDQRMPGHVVLPNSASHLVSRRIFRYWLLQVNGRRDHPPMGLSGATRIPLTVGDPIAQAKSPEGLTREFAARGIDAACIPMQVPVADFDAFMTAAKRVLNIDGIVVTVPHKFSAARHCESLSGRARSLSAVNVMRREADGRWTGDMTDGIALVAALRANGCEPRGRRALVVGAGG